MSSNPLASSEPWNLVADEAITASKLKPNATVLDVACGPATLALRLTQHAGQVHGIDFSVPMLAVYHNVEIRSITKAHPTGSTGEFWDFMVKDSVPNN